MRKLENRERLVTAYAWEIFEEFVQRYSGTKIIKKRVYRYSRTFEYRSAADNLRINIYRQGADRFFVDDYRHGFDLAWILTF